VFKELTNRRRTEAETYSDVLRDALKLPKPGKALTVAPNGRPWIVRGATFPVGSEFIADYKGKMHSGTVKDGKLELTDGGRYRTPSAAAMSITKSNVNGWRFWKCKLPGASQFVLIETLRGKAH
jgi:Restriction Enzyme Adenine Methylase Associated